MEPLMNLYFDSKPNNIYEPFYGRKRSDRYKSRNKTNEKKKKKFL